MKTNQGLIQGAATIFLSKLNDEIQISSECSDQILINQLKQENPAKKIDNLGKNGFTSFSFVGLQISYISEDIIYGVILQDWS